MSEPGRFDLVSLFAEAGCRAYGESVTQLEHALQCAALARHDRADDDVVVAALLHDIGHLVEDKRDRPQRHHGGGGAALVGPFVSPRIAWLIEVCPPLIEYAPLLERRFGPQAWMGGAGIDRGA